MCFFLAPGQGENQVLSRLQIIALHALPQAFDWLRDRRWDCEIFVYHAFQGQFQDISVCACFSTGAIEVEDCCVV